MTAFEFVFALITIITSLALTHLLAGFIDVLRNAERVRLSWVHGLWAWSAMLLTIGNWASFWEMRSLTQWPAWTVLLGVAVMITLYVFCGLVTPDLHAAADMDLRDFHQRAHHRYALAAAIMFAVSIAANIAWGEAGLYASWMRDNLVSVLGLVFGLVAYFVGAAWAQVSAAALMAALATYYAIITCNVVSA
jgi:hypothetical protein